MKGFQGPIAITMTTSKTDTELPSDLNKLWVPSYTHTINNIDKARYYMEKGITEIYTDFLLPYEF